MEYNEAKSILQEVFAGRDPLAEAHATMQEMDHEALTKLVLIAANKVGLLMKGSDYENGLDAAIHLCQGIDLIFLAYDEAWFNLATANNQTGHA